MVSKPARFFSMVMLVALWASTASAQVTTQRQSTPPGAASKLPPPPPVVEPDYRIGVGDVLVITAWKEPEASGEVIVRPDGKVTLQIGNEIMALGLTTDEFKKKVEEQLKSFYEPIPSLQIQVKQINSRMVFITGAVAKPGPYQLLGNTSVLQLISMAGGLLEFADKKHITVISATLKDAKGLPRVYQVNYKDLIDGKNLQRNYVELRPGDQIIVR